MTGKITQEGINLSDTVVFGGLGLVLVLVLILPFVSKRVEHNIEVFLFVMGLVAAAISGALGLELGGKALREPIFISAAVLGAGLLFKIFMKHIRMGIHWLLDRVSVGVFAFALVVVLGLTSSIITAIIASLVLVEIVSVLNLPRRAEVTLDVIACFAIGLGAALTPIGEPLSTIAVSNLGESFWFLLRLIGPYAIPGVVVLGGYAAFRLRRQTRGRRKRLASDETGPEGRASQPAAPGDAGENAPEATLATSREEETYHGVVFRALRVYLFVMALVLLGEGFRPVIDRFVIGLPSQILYWLNMTSAVLDNATLTAAEVSVRMSSLQVRSVLMGLLISGGMLIPGNIPNIISAGKLDIGSREWASIGVPLGLVVMAIYYVILFGL